MPRGQSRITHSLVAAATISVLCMTGHAALGADVAVEVSPREIYFGESFTLAIQITNARNQTTPTLPPMPGARVRPTGTQTTRSFGAGRAKSTVIYQYRVTPLAPGTFTVPAFMVTADGEQFSYSGAEVLVETSEAGELLFLELTGPKRSVYVGENVKVTLEVWLRVYRDKQLGVTLSEASMWSLIPLADNQWGGFTESLADMERRQQRPRGAERFATTPEGTRATYYVYSITRAFQPERPGKLDVGKVRVAMRYPRQLSRERNRGFGLLFGGPQLTVSRSRAVSAFVDSPPIDILPLPTEGQPTTFSGAVGRCTLEVSAKPTEVRVGDPITLTLTLGSQADLESLQPPPLGRLTALTEAFKIPDEPLAGVIDGKVKRFTQTVRARHGQVAEIPPIPLTFFLPETGTYETVYSDPIPLVVSEVARLSLEAIIDSGATTHSVTRLTETQGGILANYADLDAISDDSAFSLAELGQSWAAGAVAVPPMLFGACWFIDRRRTRRQSDTVRLRRRSARKNALTALGRAGGHATASDVTSAVSGYVADRCNLPIGGLTGSDVVAGLTERQVSGPTLERVERFFEQAEAVQYAGSDKQTTRGLLDQARECISLLERERF